MRYRFALVLILLPFLAQAQSWRVQASGGIATATPFSRKDDIVIGPQVPGMATNSLITSHMPNENALFASWGLSLFRTSGNREFGLQAEAMSVRTCFKGAFSRPGSGGVESFDPYTVTAYAGRPVIPVTIVYNYYAGSGRASGYVGLHAGVAYASGQRQIEFNEMAVARDIRMYYNSAWGAVAGLLAGYRKELGPVDIGFQLQLKYMQFNLRHGNSEIDYRTQLLVPQLQLYAGYRFGQKPAKPAAAASE